jgi:3-dehydroquinate synthase
MGPIIRSGRLLPTIHTRFTQPRSAGYLIVIRPGLASNVGAELKRRFAGHGVILLSSPRVHGLWGRAVEKKLGLPLLGRHLVPDGERHKNFKQFERALQALARLGKGAKSKPLVLALGGGVLGDLAGFAAASYKRGIPFVQMPSTLLSMVDSSVGGKLGIDFNTPDGLIKNLVGAFYQPGLVLVDPLLLRTLPPRELRAGLAEVVKTAVLFDPALFRRLEKNAPALLRAEPALLAAVIAACVAHKARVVGRDEFDVKGERALLNLGHTFGHAVEAASGFRLLHGEGVAFGLACACDLSHKLGLSQGLPRVEALLSALQLPVRLAGLPLKKVLAAMGQDKKFDGGARFILPRRLGLSVVHPLPSLAPALKVLQARFI